VELTVQRSKHVRCLFAPERAGTAQRAVPTWPTARIPFVRHRCCCVPVLGVCTGAETKPTPHGRGQRGRATGEKTGATPVGTRPKLARSCRRACKRRAGWCEGAVSPRRRRWRSFGCYDLGSHRCARVDSGFLKFRPCASASMGAPKPAVSGRFQRLARWAGWALSPS